MRPNSAGSAKGGLRVFVVGLDGATLDLIAPWAKEGKLPTLSRMMSEGCYGRLISTIPPVTGPAWATFMTGKNPGKHGVGDFFQRSPREYRRLPVNATSIRAEPLWVVAGRQGRRIGLLNVPMTYPPYEVNGFLVSGLLTPRRGARFAYPEELAEELDDAVGGYRVNLDHFYTKGAAEPFLEDLRELVDVRTRAAEYLMARHQWDFFMVHYIATDWVQHFLWHCIDPHHPRYDEAEAHRYGDAILRIYQQVDGALGRLISGLDKKTVVMVVSDHGFGPFHNYVYLNNLLLRNGLLFLKSRPATRLKYLLFRRGLTPANLYTALARLRMVKLAFKASKKQRYNLMSTWFLSAEDVDWTTTRAYAAGNIGQLFLNVKGREPSGVVEPGTEYEELRETLISMLCQLRDPDTGELVVEHAYKREEIYNGPYTGRMADILLLFRNMEYGSTGLSEFGSNSVIAPSFSYTGSHRMDGLFMLMGDAVKSGLREQAATMADMAPTILYLLGLPISPDMDGQVLTGLLEDDVTSDRPVCYSDEEEEMRGSGPELTDEEIEELTDRLRSLGYVS